MPPPPARNPFIAQVNSSFPDPTKEPVWLYDRLNVTVRKVAFRYPLSAKWKLRISLREVRQVTSPLDVTFGREMDLDIPFDARLAVLLFARIKFDILEEGLFFGDRHVARGRKRIRDMIDAMLADSGPKQTGILCKDFTVDLYKPEEEPLFPRMGDLPDAIGRVTFTLTLSFDGSGVKANLSQVYPFRDCTSISDAEWDLIQAQTAQPNLPREIAERFEQVQKEAARIGSLRFKQFRKRMFVEEHHVPATEAHIASVTLTFSTDSSANLQPDSKAASEDDLSSSFESLDVRSASPSPSIDLDRNRPVPDSDDWADVATRLVKVVFHDSDASISKVEGEERAISLFTHIRPRIRNPFSAKADKVHEMVNGTVAGLLRDGMRIEVGSLDWRRAAKLRDDALSNFRRSLTYDALGNADLPLLKASAHFFRFAFAIYGSLITNFLSNSVDKLFIDAFQLDSDIKRFSVFCGIPMDAIKLWSRASGPLSQLTGGSDYFSPVWCLFWDAKTESVVIAIRGTHDERTAFTDLAADYVCVGIPGSEEDTVSHSGFAHSAHRIVARFFGIIKSFVAEKRAIRLVLTGHSLGSGVANLLFMLLQPLVGELQEASGHGDAFQLRVFGFGTPACVDDRAAERHADKVVNIINHCDQVPALSFGSLVDRLRITQACDFLANRSASDPVWGGANTDLAKQMDAIREAARSEGEPKLHVPGRIVYLYPPSDYKDIGRWRPPNGNSLSSLLVTDSSELTVAEWSNSRNFLDFQRDLLEVGWWIDYHMPDRYSLHLSRAIERIENRSLGRDVRQNSWASAAAEKRNVWSVADTYVYEPGAW